MIDHIIGDRDTIVWRMRYYFTLFSEATVSYSYQNQLSTSPTNHTVYNVSQLLDSLLSNYDNSLRPDTGGKYQLNPIPHGIFFSWLPWGGVESTSEFMSPILFYTVTYTYIRSSDPKWYFPSFKSSAANSTYASKFQKSKIGGQLLRPAAKN